MLISGSIYKGRQCSRCGRDLIVDWRVSVGYTSINGNYQSGCYPFMSGVHSSVSLMVCHICHPVNQSGVPYCREDWIRDSLPEHVIAKQSPATVVADWLMDQNRVADADHMRGLCSD